MCGKLLIFFMFLAGSCKIHAQKNEEVILNKFTQANGLSSYNIRKIIQDNYGFIWIATQDGLNRFDGNHFEVYRKNSAVKRQLLGADIRDIIFDSSNNLIWVLSGVEGLNAIDPLTGNVIRSIYFKSKVNEDWNISMKLANGKLWIGTFKGIKIYEIAKNNLDSPIDMPNPKDYGQDFFETRHILRDRYGNIWACFSGYGIAIFDSATNNLIKRIPANQFIDTTANRFIKFLESTTVASDDLLLATTHGLKKISYDKNYNYHVERNPCTSLNEINNTLIRTINKNNNGEFIISTPSQLYLFDPELRNYVILKEIKKKEETAWLSAVFSICNDADKNLWLGCNEGVGFIRNTPNPFLAFYYDIQSGKKLDHVHSIYVDDNNNILAGLKNGLVFIDRKISSYLTVDTAHLYHHIYEDPAKNVHAIHSNGMMIYKNKKLVPANVIYPELTPVVNFPVSSHLILGDSLVILGTENDRGIILWNIKGKSIRLIDATTKPISLAANIVNALFKDSQGKIWVLSDKSITIISADLTKTEILEFRDSATSQPYNIYFDICEANGFYWIATYGMGILQLDQQYKIKRILTSRDGLSNDGVYKIFYDDNNHVITTTNVGLSILNPNTYSFTNYYEPDGLHSNAFEEASGTTKNNLIYAGGVGGLTVINPVNFTRNRVPPQLFINSAIINSRARKFDTSNLFFKIIEIPNDVLQTTINFSALNYANPSRTTYSYKIKELHNDWITLNTQNFVNLIGVSPGTYHLQVQAFNEDGVPSEIKELTLIFLPKWYQTLAFKILVLLTVAAIFYGLYKFRINHLKKEEKIRNQVAGDLHDELGSTLNSVKIFTSLALMEKDNKSHLEKIKEATQYAIASVKDIIWVLDDKRDTLDHLLSRINQFANPLCEAAGISYKQQADENLENYRLGKEEKRNLYMIIKESINNSIKYSDCSLIELLMKNKGGKLNISISDNGKGFDRNEISSGYGLKNILRRSAEIGYHAEINSSPGNGTLIYLEKN